MLLRDYFDKMTPENLAAYHAANKKISDAWERGISETRLVQMLEAETEKLCEIGAFLLLRNWGESN